MTELPTPTPAFRAGHRGRPLSGVGAQLVSGSALYQAQMLAMEARVKMRTAGNAESSN